MPAKVELTRMSQQTGTKCLEDDWTGTSDSAIRRKLQNRLNQRIYRQRRKAPSRIEAPQLQERSILGEAKSTHSANPLTLSITTSLRNEKQSSQFERPSNSSTTSSADISIKRWTPGRVSRYQGFCEIRLMLVTFEEEARRNYLMGSPRTDQLLTLIQFNVFRALIKNTRKLGWKLDWLDCTIDPLPPWLNPGAHCPQALCPTNIQRTIPHHPWLDLWPIPQMRDNLLLHAGSYDEDRLCNDLVEFGGLMNEQSGLIVWGELWDVSGWEVSETFLKNWGWAVKGCKELLASTNSWRAKEERKLLFLKSEPTIWPWDEAPDVILNQTFTIGYFLPTRAARNHIQYRIAYTTNIANTANNKDHRWTTSMLSKRNHEIVCLAKMAEIQLHWNAHSNMAFQVPSQLTIHTPYSSIYGERLRYVNLSYGGGEGRGAGGYYHSQVLIHTEHQTV